MGHTLLVLNNLVHHIILPIKFKHLTGEKLEMKRGWLAEEDALFRSGVARSPGFWPVQPSHQVKVAFALRLDVNNGSKAELQLFSSPVIVMIWNKVRLTICRSASFFDRLAPEYGEKWGQAHVSTGLWKSLEASCACVPSRKPYLQFWMSPEWSWFLHFKGYVHLYFQRFCCIILHWKQEERTNTCRKSVCFL